MLNKFEKSLSIYNEGICAFKNEDYLNALKLFKESLKIFEHGKTLQRISDTFEKLNDFEGAFTSIQNAYFLSPTNDIIGLKYANYLIKRNETENAKCILNNIIERNPSYLPAKKMLESILI
jgi:tetratricopeptide (TPR) repeat protein